MPAPDDATLIDAATGRYATDDVDVLSVVEGRDDDGAWVHALVYVPYDDARA